MRMFCYGLVHPDSRIIGVLRNRSKEEWMELMHEGLNKHSSNFIMDDDK